MSDEKILPISDEEIIEASRDPELREQMLATVEAHPSFMDRASKNHNETIRLWLLCQGLSDKPGNPPLAPPPGKTVVMDDMDAERLRELVNSEAYIDRNHAEHKRVIEEVNRIHGIGD